VRDEGCSKRPPTGDLALSTHPSRRTALATAAAAFASIAILPRGVRAAGTTFKLGHDLFPAHPLHIRLHEFAENVKAATNGELEITVFPSSLLGGDTQMLAQVRSNAMQMFAGPGGVIASVAPQTSITYVGYAFRDYKTIWAAMDGDVGAFCRAGLEKIGLVPMPAIWNNGFNQVYSSLRPIETPADFAGFKIRTSASPIFVSTFKALGASPTPINLSETYTALQTKLVDGVTDPLAIVEFEKFFEVQKYASLTNQMWGGYWVVANPDAWNGLSKGVKETVMRLNREAALKQRDDVAKVEVAEPERLAQRGMVVNKPDHEAFRKKMRDAGFYADWRRTFGDDGWRALEKYTGPLG
jgi:tripartite ATP-independent transporter DctP family solute receptor